MPFRTSAFPVAGGDSRGVAPRGSPLRPPTPDRQSTEAQGLDARLGATTLSDAVSAVPLPSATLPVSRLQRHPGAEGPRPQAAQLRQPAAEPAPPLPPPADSARERRLAAAEVAALQSGPQSGLLAAAGIGLERYDSITDKLLSHLTALAARPPATAQPSREQELAGIAAATAALRTARAAAAQQYLKLGSRASRGDPAAAADAAAQAARPHLESFSGEGAASALHRILSNCKGLSSRQKLALQTFCDLLSEAACGPGGGHLACAAVQLPRLQAAVAAADAAGNSAAAQWRELVSALPEDCSEGSDAPPPAPRSQGSESEAESSTREARQRAVREAALAVAAAQRSQRRVAEMQAAAAALGAAAGDYRATAEHSATVGRLSLRVAELMQDLREQAAAQCRRTCADVAEERDQLDREAGQIHEEGAECLRRAGQLLRRAEQCATELRAGKRRRIVTARRAAEEDNAVHAVIEAFEAEIKRQRAIAAGGAASAVVANGAADCVAACSEDTAAALKRGAAEAARQLQRAQTRLHDAAARRWAELTARAERAAAAAARAPGSMPRQQPLGESSAGQREAAEMNWIRAVVDQYGTHEAMGRMGRRSFLEEHDSARSVAEAAEHFDTLMAAMRRATEALHELADAPAAAGALPAEGVIKGATAALHRVVVVLGDGGEFGSYAQRLGDPRQREHQHRRLGRAAGQLRAAFSDCAAAQPAACARHRRASAALPEGGEARSLLELAHAALGAMSAAVDAVGSAAAAQPAPPRRAHCELRALSFGAVSRRLQLQGSSRVVKPPRPGQPEQAAISDATALSAEAFIKASGVHSWAVRCEAGSADLMVGVSDPSIPVNGICNAVHHRGCYFLNTSKGTLWSRYAGAEGRPYCEPLRLDVHHLVVSLDTDRGTLRYAHGGRDLGVAFSDIPLRQPLRAALEIAEPGACVEFAATSGSRALESEGEGETGSTGGSDSAGAYGSAEEEDEGVELSPTESRSAAS